MSTLEVLTSPEALDTFLIEELTKAGSERLVIHAGHYALIRNHEGVAQDCLMQAGFPGSELGFAEFSRATWKAACRAMAIARPSLAQLMVLVNDWQFLTGVPTDRRSSESVSSELRNNYYRATPTLPNFHLDELGKNKLSKAAILGWNTSRWLFSERTLRNELVALITNLVKDQEKAAATGIDKYYNANGEPIVD